MLSSRAYSFLMIHQLFLVLNSRSIVTPLDWLFNSNSLPQTSASRLTSLLQSISTVQINCLSTLKQLKLVSFSAIYIFCRRYVSLSTLLPSLTPYPFQAFDNESDIEITDSPPNCTHSTESTIQEAPALQAQDVSLFNIDFIYSLAMSFINIMLLLQISQGT